jgi:hypothetical protein
MALCPKAKIYVLNNLAPKYPNLSYFIVYLIDIVHLLSLTMCINFIVDSIILPLLTRLIITLKNILDGILYMSGINKGDSGIAGSISKKPSPGGPEKPTNIGLSKSEEKKKDKKKSNDDIFGDMVDDF